MIKLFLEHFQLNTSQPAFFESNNYYTEKHFDDLLGIDAQHPLVRINNFNKEYGSK